MKHVVRPLNSVYSFNLVSFSSIRKSASLLVSTLLFRLSPTTRQRSAANKDKDRNETNTNN
jgi:hypothetical protein